MADTIYAVTQNKSGIQVAYVTFALVEQEEW